MSRESSSSLNFNVSLGVSACCNKSSDPGQFLSSKDLMLSILKECSIWASTWQSETPDK